MMIRETYKRAGERLWRHFALIVGHHYRAMMRGIARNAGCLFPRIHLVQSPSLHLLLAPLRAILPERLYVSKLRNNRHSTGQGALRKMILHRGSASLILAL